MRVYIILLVFALACTNKSQKPAVSDTTAVVSHHDSTTYNIIKNSNGGFGYEVYQSGKLLISQPHPPGLPDGKGFASERQAHAVAAFVVEKLKAGHFPPTVQRVELDSLMRL